MEDFLVLSSVLCKTWKKKKEGGGKNLCEREYRKPLVDNSSKLFIESSFDSQPELAFWEHLG